MDIKKIPDRINSSRVLFPIKIAVTAVVVYFVNKSLPVGGLSALAAHISTGFAVAALVLGFLIVFIQVRRWRLVLACSGIDVDNVTAWRTMLWGCLLAFITPGRTGELFRGLSLPANKKSDTVWAAAADKIFAGFGVIAAGAISLIAYILFRGRFLWAHWMIAIASTAFFIGVYLAYRLRNKRIICRILDHAPVFTLGKFLEVCIYSIAAQVLCCVQTAALFGMFGGSFSISSASAAGLAYTFMMLFPFFIANMGIREFSFGLFFGCIFSSFSQTGVSAIALGASMGILFINIVLPALAGLGWWLIYKNNKKAVSKDGSV